jgi:hypothetical protein
MEILTLQEASSFLKISPSTLRRLCRELSIPHRQHGRGRIFFDKGRLVDWWMRDHKPEPVELRIKKLKLIRRMD